jgi:hypothetical protein
MAKLTVKQTQDMACKIVAANPGGIRLKALLDAILSTSPETPKNTIRGAIWDLEQKFPAKVTKPERGLYVPFSPTDDVAGVTDQVQIIAPSGAKLKEEDRRGDRCYGSRRRGTESKVGNT